VARDSDQTPAPEDLQAVLDTVWRYRAGRVGLPELSASLDVHLSVLEHPADEWTERCREAWRAVEEVNALLLDEAASIDQPQHRQEVELALEALERCIRERLAY
jgi:hypothetical protein